MLALLFFHFFFFNATATTEIYTLSLHDALPICLLATLGHRALPGRVRSRARAHAPSFPEGSRQEMTFQIDYADADGDHTVASADIADVLTLLADLLNGNAWYLIIRSGGEK